ncbi:MAG TPA: hypothetical protein DCP28_32445, partial [Cytophagales bacterium]|nr:hypothetical protein [Cytophagales bacterium]
RAGEWGTPINLGPEVNTSGIEFAPYLSPDGQFLFFSRRDQWENATFSTIYWVSMELVDSLRAR